MRNRDAQVWGWFDVKDNRHWPAGGQGNPPGATNAPKPGDIAGAYVARDGSRQPQGLTLEKLRLQFEGNVYFAAPGQGGFHWGPSWTRHQRYAGLPEFQSELRIDAGSRVLDPGFADALQLDFRLTAETMTTLQECYPRGPVPNVVLGVIR